MKVRNQINQELEKQLKLAANKPVLSAIIKSQIQQNVLLTIIMLIFLFSMKKSGQNTSNMQLHAKILLGTK
jgi:hypothetical protein